MNDVDSSDSLTVNGSAEGDHIVKGSNSINHVASDGHVYSRINLQVSLPFQLQELTINGQDGDDLIEDPGSDTTLLGGPGNDTIVVNATTGTGITADGGEDSDTIIAVSVT